MASPVIISGKNIEIHQISNGPTITIPFETDAGRFVVEANLQDRE
jgi:CheY-specific phosphatase CheX